MFIFHHGAVTREVGCIEYEFTEFHASDFKKRAGKKKSQNSLRHGQEQIPRPLLPIRNASQLEHSRGFWSM